MAEELVNLDKPGLNPDQSRLDFCREALLKDGWTSGERSGWLLDQLNLRPEDRGVVTPEGKKMTTLFLSRGVGDISPDLFFIDGYHEVPGQVQNILREDDKGPTHWKVLRGRWVEDIE